MPSPAAVLRFAVVCAALALSGLTQADAAPRIRALLVGAAAYDVPEAPALGSPRNDVLLAATALMAHGVKPADIVLLVQDAATVNAALRRQNRSEVAFFPMPAGLRIAGPPRHDAIVKAFEDMVAAAGPGDEVFVLLSGHADQQATDDLVRKPDGRDEVFLPVDIRLRAAADEPVPNGIVSYQIGRWIDAMRAKGADVIYLGDYCHAAGSTRGARKDWRGPPTLDRAPVNAAPQVAHRVDAAAHLRGSYVGFFAAPSDAYASADLGPAFSADDRHLDGFLTMYAIPALFDPGVNTYRDAAHLVQLGYQAQADALSRAYRYRAVAPDASDSDFIEPPEFDGALDAPVFGRGAAASSGGTVWVVSKPATDRLDALQVRAGALQGLGENAIVALEQRLGPQPRTLLYGRATDVQASTATLVPVDYGGIPAGRWNAVLDGFGRPFAAASQLSARVVERGMAFSFVVVRPQVPASPTPQQETALTALDAAAKDDAGIRFVAAGHPGDLILAFRGDSLALVRASDSFLVGTIDLREGSGTPDAAGIIRQRIGNAVALSARAAKLRRIVYTMSSSPADPLAPANALRIESSVWIAPTGPDARGVCPVPPGVEQRYRNDVAELPAGLTRLSAADLGNTPHLKACDAVYVTVRNTGGRSLDLTALLLLPTAAVVSPERLPLKGPPVRLDPQTSAVYGWQFDPRGSPSVDDMAIIVVDRDPMIRDEASFFNLRQPAATAAAGLVATSRSRGPSTPSSAQRLAELLDAVLEDNARGASAGALEGRSSIVRLSWMVAP